MPASIALEQALIAARQDESVAIKSSKLPMTAYYRHIVHALTALGETARLVGPDYDVQLVRVLRHRVAMDRTPTGPLAWGDDGWAVLVEQAVTVYVREILRTCGQVVSRPTEQRRWLREQKRWPDDGRVVPIAPIELELEAS